MSSHLACLGMSVTSPAELDALVAEVVRLGREPIGTGEGVLTYSWQDGSGARVVFDLIGSGKPLILPAFRSRTDFAFHDLSASGSHVVRLSITGPDGVTGTGVVTELEQRRHLEGITANGRITLCLLGVNVQTFADEAAFLASDTSLLGTEEELGEAPPEVLEQGLAWPPRMSARAFFADGYFDDPEQAKPYALMSGLVTEVETRTNALTHQPFVLSRVSTAFGEVDLCLSAVEHADLTPGQVVSGTVGVVGSVRPGATAASVAAPTSASAEPAAPAEPEAAPAGTPSADPEPRPVDDAPHPGETRREWRARTGRSG